MTTETHEIQFESDATWPTKIRVAGRMLRNVMLFVLMTLSAQANDDEPQAEGKPTADAAANQAVLTLAEQANALLNVRCVTCHGPEKSDGNLRLDSRESLLKGGDRGPAFLLGDSDQSLILRSISGTETDLEMPPKQKLSTAEVALIKQWLKAGAPWPEPLSPSHNPDDLIGPAWTDSRNPIARIFGGKRLDVWSLKPVQNPDPPHVEPESWPRGDLDRFVLRRFKAAGHMPKERADRHTLIRRLSLDLTGLPPSPEDAARFEAGRDEEDVEGLIDQLLASPRFGEHFARMWLDTVRYSDSNGFDWDEFRPQAYRFRDYVIRSLNADKPFDQFVREQLAGDELLAGSPKTTMDQDLLIATGFLRLGPHDNAAAAFNEQDRGRHEWLTDLTETTSSAFLGLTFSCCRCHDHKYDPLSQADYYRLRGFFAAVKFADDLALDLDPDQQSIQSYNEKVDAQIAELEKRRDAIDSKVKRRLKNENAEPAEVEKALNKLERKKREKLQSQIETATKQKRPLTHALLVTDGELQLTHVLYQGDYKSPRDVVEPGIPSIFDPQPLPASTSARDSSSGRRLALAEWIVNPSNPLTSRVFVNRVWQSLMGQGLVRTPGDYGLAGLPPEDPELLDWLASQFVQQKWSIKQLIKQIVLSATYQQAASFEDVPDGLFYAVRQPRRLTAEQLRDAMLSVSGLLTDKADGPAIWPDLPREVLEANPALLDDNELKTKGWYPSEESEQTCRSIFLIQKRNTRIPFLESFDQPENSVPCARRLTSIVAPQAISLLNGEMSVKAARAFANRIEREVAAEGTQRQIARAFEVALQRKPTAEEQQACSTLMQARSLTEVCRVLLNLTEFSYVD